MENQAPKPSNGTKKYEKKVVVDKSFSQIITSIGKDRKKKVVVKKS